MEKEKLQAAKAILLDNDGNKFTAIKAFMTQEGADIDTAASYINQAYTSLDSPNTSAPSSTALVPYCEPPNPAVREYIVETKSAPEPTMIKEFDVIETKPQAAPEEDSAVNTIFSIFAVLVYLAEGTIKIGWILLKIFLYLFIMVPFKILTLFLLFFYTDKAINRRRRDYWF